MSRAGGVTAGLLAAGLVVGLAGLMHGYVPYGPWQVVRGLLGVGDPVVVAIVREVRLPRLLLAVEVGAALGMAGAAMQGLLRNPLAEPGLVGVSASAGLGAVVAFHFGLAALSAWAVPLAAMAGAGVVTVLLLAVAHRTAGSLTLILAGIALSSLAVALTSLALNLAPNPYALSEMTLWLLGSLKDRSMEHVGLVLPFLLVGGLLLVSSGRGLDALSLGEESAQSLGVDLRRLRVSVIAGTALVVGAAVAVSGSIGFVGLVVPHLLRPWLGYEPGRLLLPSAAGGAVLVMLADGVARALPTSQEVMVGVVTALVGAPFFLLLILRLNREAP
jgi:iron complex transport system permease protein